MKEIRELANTLRTFSIFSGIYKDTVLSSLLQLVETIATHDTHTQVKAYAQFASALYQHGGDLSLYVLDFAKGDVNPYIKRKANGEPVPPSMQACAGAELSLLAEVAAITSKHFKDEIDYPGFLPDWENSPLDIRSEYSAFAANAPAGGYGVFAQYHMFAADAGNLIPIATPDGISLADLSGYEYERNQVLESTLSFLRGGAFSNVLLYGDSGTGKSSTIKAIANEFGSQGLRLVEFRKDQLSSIPAVIRALAGNPLKFIFFIDDLSFTHDGDDYIALKAILEGSVFQRPSNIAVYVTSNRRHLVKESFSDREGDDVHINETIQQTVSLSDRFGLTVPFVVPSRDTYLGVVDHIAARMQLPTAQMRDLHMRAESYAIQKGGRSPRVARQFIEAILSGVE